MTMSAVLHGSESEPLIIQVKVCEITQGHSYAVVIVRAGGNTVSLFSGDQPDAIHALADALIEAGVTLRAALKSEA